ncbi:helix-turn-helix domain-containing protein [Lactobacillus gallinarum]|uniref:helix-turn-helix domain-containing protein n=1 Tax=Lactobacillus gallinarum TaxID=52242 RepID=UPI0024B1372C|nr:helix-turn-helix transcriptional regulator [Lactobacillus gallinarum]
MMKDIYLFSHRLKRARKLKKLTQEGLAKKLYVSKSTEQRWEEAIRVPNKEMLERISMVLDVDIDYLLGLQNRRRVKFTYQPVVNGDTKEVSYMKVLK